MLPIAASLVGAGLVLGGLIYFLQHVTDSNILSPKPPIESQGKTPPNLPSSQSTFSHQKTQPQEHSQTADTGHSKRINDERAKVGAERQRLAEDEAPVEAKRRKAEQETAARKAEDEARKERERQLAEARDAERKRVETAKRLEAESQVRKEQEREAARRRETERQPSPSSPAVHDQQLETLLAKFKTTYENRDFDGLQTFSEMNQARVRNVELMFENYSTIAVSVQIVSITEQEATATLTYDKLVKPTGEVVTLKPIARTIKNIKIKKEGNQWKKIVW